MSVFGAASLQHPGIAVVFDVDVHAVASGHMVFMVMDLLSGRDLRAVLLAAPGGLPVSQAPSGAWTWGVVHTHVHHAI